MNALTNDDIERVAERVVELLSYELGARGGSSTSIAGLVDVATVAAALSVSEKHVRKHAEQLGGRRIAGLWRFDLDVARAGGAESHPAQQPTARQPRRTVGGVTTSAPLLRVRG
jgi:hypothetical protein